MADCVAFYSFADVAGHDRMTENGDPAIAARRRRQVRQLYDFFEGRGCRHQRLVRHFDQTIEPCGVACDRCRGDDVLGTGPAGGRPPPRPRPRPPMAGPGDTSAIGGSDAVVFARLRALRRRLADERHVPAYVVFGDATLLEMA